MEPRRQSVLNENLKKVCRSNATSNQGWKWPSSGKENASSVKSKTVLSANQAEQVLKEVKVNATKTLSNLKSTFGNISQKLRRSTRRRSNASVQPYEEFDNCHTPVKLYSPFDIVTPSPRKDVPHIKTRTPKRLTPRRFTFVSPTGKFKKDVEDLSNGMRELHTVARSLPMRKSRGNAR